MKKFYIPLVILTLFSNYIYSVSASDPADWMPDANLRTAVRSTLKIGSNDTLTEADMTDLTRLTARNKQISNLTGLEKATNLKQLDLRDNKISSISTLSGLTSLKSLKLKGNNIRSVSDLSGLTNLTLLNLKNNNIRSISGLSGLTNLEHLRVDGNSITDVQPLTGLTSLKQLWIAGNSLTNAHLLSSLTGLTDIDITIPDPPDTTQPGVTISVETEHVTAIPGFDVNGPFKITITFTESVSNFEQSDILLERGRAEISNFNASEASTYTADVTPELDEENRYIRFVIPSGAATDAAGNPNREGKSSNVYIDMERPNVYITAPTSNVTTETFTVTIKFADEPNWRAQEPFGFDQWDLSLINNTAGATVTGWSLGTDHITTATITVTQSGSVTFGVAEGIATDSANNNNTASLLKTVTVRRPGSAPPESPDTDTTQPGVTISVETEHVTAIPGFDVNGPFKITITFTESVSNFEQSDILLERGRAEISNFNASEASTYTADVTPELDEENRYIRFVIPSGAATDAAGNPNREGKSSNVYIDMERPNVYITAPTSNVTTETFTVTIKFADEPNWRAQEPFGFDQWDLSLINNTAGATVTGWSLGTDHITTATITVTQSGSVTFGVAEGIATDSANNNNTASLLKTVTVRRPGSAPPESPDTDTTQPGVTISVETEHVTAIPGFDVNGPFKITITFTESVSNFEQSDILLEKGRAEISNFSASEASTYTADVTPELDEENRYIRFMIPSGAATDAAGNPNREGKSSNVYIDMERPNVYITAPTSNVTTETFTVTIKFADEPNWRAQEPFDFDQWDLSLINNTAGATVTGWSLGTDHITTATITVTQSGSVTFRVAEGIATDSANNNNTASLLKTVTVRHPNAAPSANGSVPDQTLLQPNYPNPFNPETWIPYHLANDSDVQISIYDINGALVRQLDLGYQQAGYYTNRSRAAYWDGRNEFGEWVATGIYFYQLRADNMSLLRKMVILK